LLDAFLVVRTLTWPTPAPSLYRLPGTGDDWGILFTQWNLLLHDQQIGHTARALGWLGMLVSISWLTFRTGHNTLPCPVSRQIRLANERQGLL
jgi:hypothetical protein